MGKKDWFLWECGADWVWFFKSMAVVETVMNRQASYETDKILGS